jgi:N-carbamoyl-L-amino-acid hydrolase
MNELRINGSRLWQSLMDLARIGATPKAASNASPSPTSTARAATWSSSGQGSRPGHHGRPDRQRLHAPRRQQSGLPPIVTGSHIDTQPTGGKFDGNYGVLAGLEVVRTLNEHGIRTEAPIEVAFWTNEEGSRFVPVMMGSGVFCGAFSLETRTRRATSTARASARSWNASATGRQDAGRHPIGAYFETHIEQGPVLEDEGKVIGVVPAVMGLSWYDCTVTGMEAHAGPTPMALRRDALQVATRIMQETVAIAEPLSALWPRHGRHGAGVPEQPQRDPGPGQVQHRPAQRERRAAEHDARRDHGLRPGTSGETGLAITLERVSYYPPCPFHPDCVGAVRAAAAKLGYSTMDVVSGAGHDAIYVARLAPAGMIFVPCKDGISHNEIEDAQPATWKPAATCCCMRCWSGPASGCIVSVLALTSTNAPCPGAYRRSG